MAQNNRSARIPCGIGTMGRPQPAFQWARRGEGDTGREISQPAISDRFSVDAENGELVVSVARHSDSGGYWCTATNSIGSVSELINVLVLGKHGRSKWYRLVRFWPDHFLLV